MNASAMGFGDRTGDAQSQPRTLFALIHGRRSPVKALKDLLKLLSREANTSVCDAQSGPRPVVLHGQRYLPTSWGVLDTIIDQV